MAATTAEIDFTFVDNPYEHPDEGTVAPLRRGAQGGVIGRPITSKEKKQIRQRARRKLKKVSEEELEILYGKGIDEWDLEELAKGRPRARDGSWKGSPPPYIDRRVHEQIVKRFEELVRGEMNAHTVGALGVLGKILENDEVDDKGKPVVPAGTKLEAAKFLIEHVVGKPKQRTETDISVKLQGILGAAIVNPSQLPGGQPQLTAGFIEVPSWEEDDDDDDDRHGD